MGYLVFCNADEFGVITEGISGYRLIPDKQYEYFFYFSEPIDLMDYAIVNGELTLK